ncbi:MAG: exodeoxyribonuclease VII large subunit [Thermodesulfobacteriota bacterium]
MDNALHRHLYTVSELTFQIRECLEEKFPLIWVTGEVSNFRRPASGHFYFTLKDDGAQIASVMFRGQNRRLKCKIEDGMSLTGLGRISVYEPRGSYQLIFEYLEPKGVGELQVAFEQLKSRLAAEGIFDEACKKPLPFLPNRISVITSRTGAVIHDILKVAQRRFENVPIQVLPVKVQGYGSEMEIVSAIELVNQLRSSDVIILARGGGSLEDLQAFNSEIVARAVFASEIPVVCGVGHETDFTIADFAADLRAPTPSAAAEMVLPSKTDLHRRHMSASQALIQRMYSSIGMRRKGIQEISRRVVHPRRRIQNHRLRIDDLTSRLAGRMSGMIHSKRERLDWRVNTICMHMPLSRIHQLRNQLRQCRENLWFRIRSVCKDENARLKAHTARLKGLSPDAILSRGYSITFTLPERDIVRDADAVHLGQAVEVNLARGRIQCRVEGKRIHDSREDNRSADF